MLNIIELFIYSLFIFLNHRFARAFNESCGIDKPPCSVPFKCYNGNCLCSPQGQTTDENNPLSFWTGEQCIPCPLDYITIAFKCYKLILGKENQMNWIRARKQCQESGGELLIFRSEKEYLFITSIVQSKIDTTAMFQQIPQNGSYFASVWLGARLADWSGEGSYILVSYGPSLTKNNPHWCSKSSPLGQEPNYIAIKATGERQECVGLAILPNRFICMHDWFCSWDSYVLCEVPVPPPNITTDYQPEALEGKLNNTQLYMIIGGLILFVIIISFASFCFLCNKKKKVHHTRSIDSSETDTSEN